MVNQAFIRRTTCDTEVLKICIYPCLNSYCEDTRIYQHYCGRRNRLGMAVLGLAFFEPSLIYKLSITISLVVQRPAPKGA
ncbi:hypothetical protein BDV30DRAFT_220773 [Aspergillus minisclerotigenes]|uniref:Uncharacterized protein n=1 Tax=Aspergillus minisclerotigenes TaxID=656917 RepID=A0A5N6IL33_9EURO|nr:hypothetical protein BDV30DRAFT_220773 [Aspergillus minisclerotigenes]